MPFTIHPALRVFQQPHKHSHSLQLATHTELEHHCLTCNCRMEELIGECCGVLHGWRGGGRGDYILYFVDQYNNAKIEICISLEKLCTFSLYPIFCRYGVLNRSKLENIVLFAD